MEHKHKSWALITGASSGIGACLARECAKDGYSVVLVARRKDRLHALAREIEHEFGVKTACILVDLSKFEDVQNVFDVCVARGYDVDVLINCAGIGSFGLFSDEDMHREKEMIEVNIIALTRLTRLFLPMMIQKKHGTIMNVASVASFVPGPFMAVYYATKAYVLSFSEALNQECKHTGVSITALCPGPTASEFQHVAFGDAIGAFKGVIPDSAEVARFGYQAMKKKKVVAVHGIKNKVLLFLIRFLPRSYIRYRVEKINNDK